jgi:asparagine synthase (glutamine-hydrolysing)
MIVVSAPIVRHWPCATRPSFRMCGICGILNLNFEPVAHRDRVAAMSARLVHRGPDSHGRFERPWLAFGVRRLKIIDLTTGDQPLSNETGDVTLVYNGEIYNYRELRENLEQRGHQFRTQSDGEVILHLYEDRGVDCLGELNGMFAVALWDEPARRLMLARDRAGEKPLYYWQQGQTLVFASEIKALFEYPEVGRTLDPQAISEYLFYGYFPAPRTPFREIRKLPAAHRMVVERGRITLEPFWRLRDYLRPPRRSRVGRGEQTSLLDGLRQRLRQAAISRLVSDVPLGVFLSGGVDSSTLVALMSELSPGKVKTFSVAFAEKDFDEARYASLVARHFHTKHHVLRVDEQLLRQGLDWMAHHLDEPLADPAVIPTFLLCRFARAEITVALSGEGSDELFGGYPTYLGVRLAQLYRRLPGWLRRRVLAPLASLLPTSSGAVPLNLYLRRFFDHVDEDPARRHATWFGMLAPTQVDDALNPGFRPCTAPSQQVFAPLEHWLGGARFEDELAEALYIDFGMYLQDNLLVKVDRASMACSLELRTPYLDHRLIEFASGLPSRLKVRWGRMKYGFKKAVKPWLPRPIVYRQKRGFSVPIARWMRGSLRPLLEETLSPTQLHQDGILNATFVWRLWREHREGKADHRRALWPLLCFQLWYDRWVRGVCSTTHA